MRFSKYILDKINFILGYILYCIIIVIYIKSMKINNNVITVILMTSSVFFAVGFIGNYIIKNRYIKNIERMIDSLDEKYLISEIMKKPHREENLAYYRILKKAHKSMIENVADSRMAKEDYKEYIESWVHEIKIPITSIKLFCENNGSEITNKIDDEIEEINNYVEQALFYARLKQVSNDFMIRETNLKEVIQTILARNKRIMIQNDMKVEIKDVDIFVYSDEKWLEFILNQIIINAIKYKKENNSKVTITGYESKDNVKLVIEDNGIGIRKSELDRIFDKGFTGINGRKLKKSTGIGLYLCKKLCQELNVEIDAESIENEYTKIIIIIPRKKGEI